VTSAEEHSVVELPECLLRTAICRWSMEATNDGNGSTAATGLMAPLAAEPQFLDQVGAGDFVQGAEG
jgi:hypothetical protein